MSSKKILSKSYHHGDLRRALVEAAAKLAAAEGVSALSLRRVAAAAGVSAAAPYHHFRSKADLLAAVADEGFTRLGEAMTRAERRVRGADAQERMRRMGVSYVRFAVRNPHYFRVMFRPEIARAAEPNPDSPGERAFMKLVRVVQEVRGETGEPSRACMQRVLYAWSVVHGLAALWVDGSLSQSPPFGEWGIKQLAEIVTSEAGRGTAESPPFA